MKLTSDSFAEGAALPERCALYAPHPTERIRPAGNRNPHLAWSHLPEGTRSLVLLCIDPDVPERREEINRQGRSVAPDLPRSDFFHWIMVDIPPTLDAIAEGSCSDGLTIGGKQQPDGPSGTRQGINSYTEFLAGSDDMAGTYYGYDGPCPPWNDSIPHRYRFCLCALDLNSCPVGDDFDGPEVVAAMRGHVLARAMLTGLYSLNPAVSLR